MPQFITTSGLPVPLVLIIVLDGFFRLDVEPVIAGSGFQLGHRD